MRERETYAVKPLRILVVRDIGLRPKFQDKYLGPLRRQEARRLFNCLVSPVLLVVLWEEEAPGRHAFVTDHHVMIA